MEGCSRARRISAAPPVSLSAPMWRRISDKPCRWPPRISRSTWRASSAKAGNAVKGDEKIWAILNDKLDLLRNMGQIPEALRMAETALALARRAFPETSPECALSLEKLGQLHHQAGDRGAAKAPLLE